MTLTDALRTTLREQALFDAGETLIVAVSGGADSLALLHALNYLRRTFGYVLHAATLDHGIRGTAGAADADHVVMLAAAWGIPITRGAADVPELARQWQVGIETAARRARYTFLAETARAAGAKTVVTAHHAGDQAETVLMRLMRGSGLPGLAGMAYDSPLPGAPDLRLVRPMLALPRAVIEAYCRAHSIEFRQDETNADRSYIRNRVRHDLLPLLRTFNPQIDSALTTLADNVRLDNAFLTALAEVSLEQIIIQRSADRIRLSAEGFRTLDPSLQRRVLIAAARALGVENIRQHHIRHVQAVTIHAKQGAAADFSDNVHLRVEYGALIIERKSAPDDAPERLLLLPERMAVPEELPQEGRVRLEGGQLVLSRSDPLDAAGVRARLLVSPGARLILRGRQPGDRLRLAGSGGHSQKLSDWMINRRIPKRLRDRIPLLLIDGIIAAVLWGDPWQINPEFMIQQDSQDFLRLWLEEHKE
jgi:tRNA(Ile)-lysidine synthase